MLALAFPSLFDTHAHDHPHTQSLKNGMLRQASIAKTEAFLLPDPTRSQHTREGAPKDFQVYSAPVCTLLSLSHHIWLKCMRVAGVFEYLFSCFVLLLRQRSAHTHTHTQRGERDARETAVRQRGAVHQRTDTT